MDFSPSDSECSASNLDQLLKRPPAHLQRDLQSKLAQAAGLPSSSDGDDDEEEDDYCSGEYDDSVADYCPPDTNSPAELQRQLEARLKDASPGIDPTAPHIKDVTAQRSPATLQRHFQRKLSKAAPPGEGAIVSLASVAVPQQVPSPLQRQQSPLSAQPAAEDDTASLSAPAATAARPAPAAVMSDRQSEQEEEVDEAAAVAPLAWDTAVHPAHALHTDSVGMVQDHFVAPLANGGRGTKRQREPSPATGSTSPLPEQQQQQQPPHVASIDSEAAQAQAIADANAAAIRAALNFMHVPQTAASMGLLTPMAVAPQQQHVMRMPVPRQPQAQALMPMQQGEGNVEAGPAPAARRSSRSSDNSSPLHLHSPLFEVPELEDRRAGTKRARYTVDFKLKAIMYVDEKDPRGRGPGGAVGLKYASKRLGVTAKMLREWKRSQPLLRAAASQGIQHIGPTTRRNANFNLEVDNNEQAEQAPPVPAPAASSQPISADIEPELVAWIARMCDAVAQQHGAAAAAPPRARLTSRMVKDRALELRPGLFGERPPPEDCVAHAAWQHKVASWYERFMRRHRLCLPSGKKAAAAADAAQAQQQQQQEQAASGPEAVPLPLPMAAMLGDEPMEHAPPMPVPAQARRGLDILAPVTGDAA